MAGKMKIALFSRGRTHLCDLAKELDLLGREVQFYSEMPKFHTFRYGLKKNCAFSLFPYLFPILPIVVQCKSNSFFSEQFVGALDRLAGSLLKPCDLFIGMSGTSYEILIQAKKRYNAQIWLERGSRHILSQKEILDRAPGREKSLVSDWAVERELRGYELADKIVIPSIHVKKSFIERGISEKKLFLNPYGVDLSMFPATLAPQNVIPTAIYVGAWTYQKGVDLLVEACRQIPNMKLLHVGPLGDIPFPHDEMFVHVEPVPQYELVKYYAQAHLMVHASRQEGLSLVQAQGLACGLELVCSDRTGGEDLIQFLDDPSLIQVFPCEDVNSLVIKMIKSLESAMKRTGLREVLGTQRDKISWRSCAERYNLEIEKTFNQRTFAF